MIILLLLDYYGDSFRIPAFSFFLQFGLIEKPLLFYTFTKTAHIPIDTIPINNK
ncbi:Uncharacterised protein [Mycobacteroides abscessus subsp. abscessus]|nr:Uncharacterised protein [Mycobacteroides abscessus subsp. abscessus]